MNQPRPQEANESINTPRNVVYVSDLMNGPAENFPAVILPGTFDPMHDGHVQAKKRAEAILGVPVALMIVENKFKQNKLLSPSERLAVVQSLFPDETIYIAQTQDEVTRSHQHAQRIVRKKRSEADTEEYKMICAEYGIDFTKTFEVEDVPDVSSARFRVKAVMGETDVPAGLSEATYALLLKKYHP